MPERRDTSSDCPLQATPRVILNALDGRATMDTTERELLAQFDSIANYLTRLEDRVSEAEGTEGTEGPQGEPGEEGADGQDGADGADHQEDIDLIRRQMSAAAAALIGDANGTSTTQLTERIESVMQHVTGRLDRLGESVRGLDDVSRQVRQVGVRIDRAFDQLDSLTARHATLADTVCDLATAGRSRGADVEALRTRITTLETRQTPVPVPPA